VRLDAFYFLRVGRRTVPDHTRADTIQTRRLGAGRFEQGVRGGRLQVLHGGRRGRTGEGRGGSCVSGGSRGGGGSCGSGGSRGDRQGGGKFSPRGPLEFWTTVVLRLK